MPSPIPLSLGLNLLCDRALAGGMEGGKERLEADIAESCRGCRGRCGCAKANTRRETNSHEWVFSPRVERSTRLASGCFFRLTSHENEPAHLPEVNLDFHQPFAFRKVD